ncbi:hypothetical protein [Lacticaseibacillus sharpeae]|uniref:hypothetical protein n=1 Tax=Lacticaseibacillus sharpeae TaxID=1626 RepID=UPI0006D189A9|nr:hypothetical protein [Lacticaseibacillus sharpeae]
MSIEEENRKFKERVMHMSQAELDREMVIQANEIREKVGLGPVSGIDEVRRLLKTPPEPVVSRPSIDDMSLWQRLRYALRI